MRALAVILLGILAGCASALRKPEPAPAPAPAATTESTTVATPAAPTENAAATTSSSSNDTHRKFKPPAGWRPKIVDWELMYCWRGPKGGSHLTTELCMTEDQLKQHMAGNEAMRRDKDQSSRICTFAGCNIP